jgi:hypothetical protein
MVTALNNAAINNIQQILIRDITIDGELLNLSSSELRQVRISNMENSHEAAVITTQLSKSKISSYINKRIQFTYGSKRSSKVFYGYVITVNVNQEYQQDAMVDILCLGPSWPMQSGTPKFFVSRTAPDVFADIVAKHNLGCQTYTHPYNWPALAQTTESDWEFIQTLATRVGYVIYMSDAVVRLVDPHQIVTKTGIFRRYIRADDLLDPSRQLLDFSPTSQSLRIRDNIAPTFGYFEGTVAAVSKPFGISNNINQVLPTGITNIIIPLISNPPPYRFSTEVPIQDKAMATAYSDAWQKMPDFWNLQASARINGDVLVVPGVNIDIQVSSNSSGKNEYDGAWLVRGIEHSFTNNSFQTQLKLAKDASNNTPANVDPSLIYTNTVQGNPKVQANELGFWQSTWKAVEKV